VKIAYCFGLRMWIFVETLDEGGWNFSIHTPLLTAHHARMGTALSAYVLSCRPPTSSSAETGSMLSGQSTNQTTWVVYDVTVVTVVTLLTLSLTGRLFMASRVASYATVAVNSVCASEQCTCETCHSTTKKRETSLALAYKVCY